MRGGSYLCHHSYCRRYRVGRAQRQHARQLDRQPRLPRRGRLPMTDPSISTWKEAAHAEDDRRRDAVVPRRARPSRAHRHGRPRRIAAVVPTWFIRQDDDIVFTPRAPAVFLANLRRDPRVGLSIDEDALPYRKVSVQGTARTLYEPGADDEWRDLYRAIACRYVPADAAEAYLRSTVDQPRALIAVALPDGRVTTWRMPVENEHPTGICGPPVLRRRHPHGQPRGRFQARDAIRTSSIRGFQRTGGFAYRLGARNPRSRPCSRRSLSATSQAIGWRSYPRKIMVSTRCGSLS